MFSMHEDLGSVRKGTGQGGWRARSLRTHITPAPVVELKQDSKQCTESTMGNASACAFGSEHGTNMGVMEMQIQKVRNYYIKSPRVLRLILILTK